MLSEKGDPRILLMGVRVPIGIFKDLDKYKARAFFFNSCHAPSLIDHRYPSRVAAIYQTITPLACSLHMLTGASSYNVARIC